MHATIKASGSAARTAVFLKVPHPKRRARLVRLRGLTISSAVREVQAEQGSHVDLLTRELAGLRFENGDRLLEAASPGRASEVNGGA